MYEYFNGTIVQKKTSHIVLEVNNIAYAIIISLATFSALPANGSCRLYIHLNVREDALLLYGFATEEERAMFRLLLNVSGIGPSVGIKILSGIGIERLREAIATGNEACLTNISGVGKKTAQRIIIELREKIGQQEKSSAAIGVSGGIGIASDVVEDVISGLLALGYKRPEATAAVNKARAKNPNGTVEVLLREALKIGIGD